jgi:hypothetical protein
MKESDWISVDESLPEEPCEVNVILLNGKRSIGAYLGRGIFSGLPQFMYNYMAWSRTQIVKVDITHWAPLPPVE